MKGWQPVQTGSDEEYVHHNIMPEVVFEGTRPTYISLMKKALLQRCLKGATQSQNEAFIAIMIWNMWPKQGFAGAQVVELSAHLAAARFNHRAVTLLAVLCKMCNSKRPKESGKLNSRSVRSRNTEENLWERERKALRRKHVEGEGQTYEPGTFWPQFLWVTGVFLNLKLCAFWRSAAHSVHDNFLTFNCGPIKVYIFKVWEVMESEKSWFSRKLSFSATYPSQKKCTNAFYRQAGVTGHISDYFKGS